MVIDGILVLREDGGGEGLQAGGVEGIGELEGGLDVHGLAGLGGAQRRPLQPCVRVINKEQIRS